VLVAPSECRIERYARVSKGEWVYGDFTDPKGTLELASIACRRTVEQIYNRILF
jgi:hypothetical protein